MLNKFKEYFGFIKEEEINVTYPDTFEFTDNLDLKTDYLKILDSQEGSRQTTIEAKTSQLIGQTSIIFSLLSLFISNYVSKFNTLPFIIKALLIILFLIALFLYLATIFQATKYMNIHKYIYGQRSVSTVKATFSTEGFKIEEIKDLIYSIERNTLVNNQKCNNLIYAYRSFRIATIVVGLLSVLLVSIGYFTPKQQTSKVNIENPVVIQNLDSALTRLQNELRKSNRSAIIIHDTIFIKSSNDKSPK